MTDIHPLTLLGLALMACMTVVAVASIITGGAPPTIAGTASAQQDLAAGITTAQTGIGAQTDAPTGHGCAMHAGGGGCGCAGTG